MTMPHARLLARHSVGGGLQRLLLEPPPEVVASHVQHGQYVELRHDGPQHGLILDPETTIGAATRGYFALASTPGSPTWELVVKESGAMAERLAKLAIGDTVTVSVAQGAGFDLEKATHRPLLLAATGSGIAAVLSAARARIEAREATHTYLLHGIRDGSERTLAEEFARFKDAGLEVFVCLSREEPRFPQEEKGYVQDVAVRRGLRLGGGVAFAAGNPRMIGGLREAAELLGLTREAVVVNH